MKKLAFIAILAAGISLFFTSCLKDLNTAPLDDNEITAADVFNDPAAYRQFLAKIYAGLAVSGQQGPAGMGDISGIDEGFGQYIRGLWYHQVLSTDEAVIGWDDQTIKDFVYQQWTPSDVFVSAMYYRIFYQISIANEFLRETTEEKLNSRDNVTPALRDEIQVYRAEARFLRALSYWHALDIFANVPFVTEEDPVGNFFPPQIMRPELFKFIEAELVDILDDMVAPKQNEYGRADRAAAWMVLAKLYLNAQIYADENRYNDCVTMCKNIIDAGFALEEEYEYLFMADNILCQDEIIFRVPYHGIQTQTYGGTTFIIFAKTGGEMSPADYGIDDGWGGLRTTKALVNLFSATDPRALFFTEDQTLEIDNLSEFTNGYAVEKFTNMKRNGTPGSNVQFVDTDFPLFRLADVYLMYAEAVLRGATNGNLSDALDYVNEIRERAFGDSSGNITSGDLTLSFILDERARELYWEGHRRTDLVRFNKFAGNTGYVWPWKGRSKDGLAVAAKYNVFPIPNSDIMANQNLTQNDDY
ncbi:MAG: RagB/SusD family nutrient uptake outer membrane protein [Bacteroidetes bacterium]|nr:RagB/SusD family nutrient uptake outer membrane protein [Bacteroidota bacterium]